MSPVEFKSQYLNITIDIPVQMSNNDSLSTSTTRTVAIRQYRRASMPFDASVKSRLLSFMRQNRYPSHARTAVGRAFNGKASVSQCQTVVTAIWRSGLAGEDLQGYCDTHLGLDCSGFVNNYFLLEHDCEELNIPGYYQRGRRRLRTDLSDFRSKDVLIWCDREGNLNNNSGRHIAVIDHVQALAREELRASVVESTGTLGLVDSMYTFIETSREGVYRVNRPLKPSTRNHVRVVPVV